MYNSIKQAKLDNLISNGPWDNEPDNYFSFTYKGYNCFGRRNNSLAWCGYIEGNFTVEEKFIIDREFHCGITHESKAENKNCEILGFDCSHSIDSNPYLPNGFGTYRTDQYVKNALMHTIDEIAKLRKTKDFNFELDKI
jgi:hypothetical protein